MYTHIAMRRRVVYGDHGVTVGAMKTGTPPDNPDMATGSPCLTTLSAIVYMHCRKSGAAIFGCQVLQTCSYYCQNVQTVRMPRMVYTYVHGIGNPVL